MACTWRSDSSRPPEAVGELGHPLYLDENPRRLPGHLTDVGIYL